MGTHHFNSRPHGGRLPSPRKENFTNEISTHALTEGDHQPAATGSPVSYFNSRPHGGRLHWLFFFAHQAIFQLTPSRRATSARVSTDAVEVAFQLTPSRRATHLFGQLSFHILISTHALTEGDIRVADTPLFFPISTHALTEGDDHRSFRTPGRSHFNSRPHGGRPEETLKAAAVATISTHALTEGDVFSSVKSMHAFNFNSRPHGGRHMPDSSLFQCPQFQLTPSRRATDAPSILSISSKFQLTPSRRATMIVSFVEYCGQFQLTPSRRATLCVFPHRLPGVFQLTPSRRATILKQPPTVSATYFNSRPHGGRLISSPSFSPFSYFNSRPHGGRRGSTTPQYPVWNISTHALTEGDESSSSTSSI